MWSMKHVCGMGLLRDGKQKGVEGRIPKGRVQYSGNISRVEPEKQDWDLL